MYRLIIIIVVVFVVVVVVASFFFNFFNSISFFLRCLCSFASSLGLKFRLSSVSSSFFSLLHSLCVCGGAPGARCTPWGMVGAMWLMFPLVLINVDAVFA